ncbi:hypothetical protein GCM10009425_45510 [Pseudomonas asuensis]|uniref:Uncharacterized protein n=1 Tax=Pseudomonas asuensis TaxID=1825787 RepID=A0ABQ2H2Q4_9PSED|nr:hypothetical protein GCM10009425_45510 [Pseudomonas asuensis]
MNPMRISFSLVPKLAVYDKIKQSEIPGFLTNLEPDLDRPNIPEPRRRFLPD